MSDSNGEWAESESLAEHVMTLLDKYNIKWRKHGLIYVDHQPDNIATVNILLAELSKRLGVPSPLIHSKLIELKWLNDARYTSARDDAGRVANNLCPLKVAISEADTFEIDDEDWMNDDEYVKD
ncbi:hypothetical protein ACQKFS_03140 [Pseudomonas guineae]|uniref:hypothetical protein n=1 Tax=Pseudomonas guineae TaxID=425504 RepID=UPI003D0789FA